MWSCDSQFKLGMVNAVGKAASAKATEMLPIGETGLAWLYDDRQDLTWAGYTPANNSQAWLLGDRLWGKYNPKLKIIKIADVKPGASIPLGLLGYLSINGNFNAYTIKTANESTAATVSCKTPDVVVKMGDRNIVSAFKGVGQSVVPIKFAIALKECPEGINKVSYQLNPNTDIVDATRSVVALDAGSTAKGVGLQPLDNTGNPVALKTKLQFSEYDKLGGNFNIPLQAAYHQTAATVVPGTANTSVTFVMSYD
ncbi:hypothetical protein LMG18090_00652 [Ralstonia mannitolilytica]|nr:hypothetical protein LMG18090_00652 [Ralstonia mannitolilytica]